MSHSRTAPLTAPRFSLRVRALWRDFTLSPFEPAGHSQPRDCIPKGLFDLNLLAVRRLNHSPRSVPTPLPASNKISAEMRQGGRRPTRRRCPMTLTNILLLDADPSTPNGDSLQDILRASRPGVELRRATAASLLASCDAGVSHDAGSLPKPDVVVAVVRGDSLARARALPANRPSRRRRPRRA